MTLAEEAEDGGALKGWIPFELSRDPGPVVGEGVGTRAVAAWLLDLARDLAELLVPPGGADAHPRPGGCLFLGLACGALALQ